MSYSVKFQTTESYRHVSYGKSTIFKSGCGPASLCNALMNAGIADVSVKTMCAYSESIGARVDGGTNEALLLRLASLKYGFAYRASSKNAELMSHLKNGGTAVCWCGTKYPLFSSNSGHFVAAVGVDSVGRVVVADSYWTNGKITYNAIRREHLRLYKNTAGLVTCSIYALGRATADRSPSYYLIYKKPTKPATPAAAKPVKKEENEVIEKIRVDIAGEKFELNAITKDGHTFIDMRGYNKLIGLETGYDAASKARVVNPDRVSVLLHDGSTATVPGMYIGKGHSYVKLTDFVRAQGFTAQWDADKHIVCIREVTE